MSILSSQILQRYSMVMLLVLCAPQGVRAGFFDEILFYFCGFTLDQIDRSEILGPMGGRISPMNQPRSPGIQLVSRFNGATQVPVQVPVYQQQAMHQRAFSFDHPLGQTPQVLYVQKPVYQGQTYQGQGTAYPAPQGQKIYTPYIQKIVYSHQPAPLPTYAQRQAVLQGGQGQQVPVRARPDALKVTKKPNVPQLNINLVGTGGEAPQQFTPAFGDGNQDVSREMFLRQRRSPIDTFHNARYKKEKPVDVSSDMTPVSSKTENRIIPSTHVRAEDLSQYNPMSSGHPSAHSFPSRSQAPSPFDASQEQISQYNPVSSDPTSANDLEEMMKRRLTN